MSYMINCTLSIQRFFSKLILSGVSLSMKISPQIYISRLTLTLFSDPICVFLCVDLLSTHGK